jgi:hypothetical protein
LVVPTFFVFICAFPAYCSWLVSKPLVDNSLMQQAVQFMQIPLRKGRFTHVFAGPVAFGRKLWFAALVDRRARKVSRLFPSCAVICFRCRVLGLQQLDAEGVVR